MKTFIKVIFIFGGILLLSAALAPVLYPILPFKFEKIFNRLVMILTLLAVAFFVRFKKETLQESGLTLETSSLPLFFKGFSAGVLTLLIMTAVRLIAGNVHADLPEKNIIGFVGVFLISIVAGILIGVLEEFFFRGFLQIQIQKKFRFPIFLTVILTNLFYASLHFMSKKKPFIDSNPSFKDGLRLVLAPMMSFSEISSIWPAFVGLFILGCILSDLWIRTRSLYASIGLHAGCVFFIKMDGLFIGWNGTPNLWTGSKWFYDGVSGWVALLILWMGTRLWIQNPVPAARVSSGVSGTK